MCVRFPNFLSLEVGYFFCMYECIAEKYISLSQQPVDVRL